MPHIHFQGYQLNYTGVDTGRSNSISSAKVKHWMTAVEKSLAKHKDLFESPTLTPYDVILDFCPMGHPAYGYKQPVSLVSVKIKKPNNAYQPKPMGFFAPQDYRDSWWGALRNYTVQGLLMITLKPVRGWRNVWDLFRRCHLERRNEPMDDFVKRLARMAETQVEKTQKGEPCYLLGDV